MVAQDCVSKFKDMTIPVMVATSAFGLGIDHGRVGLVINYGLPRTLSDWVQQNGRAGRNMEEALTLLLVNRTYSQIQQSKTIDGDFKAILLDIVASIEGRVCVLCRCVSCV
jgi:ATP-dependent DNA helicase RecQ